MVLNRVWPAVSVTSSAWVRRATARKGAETATARTPDRTGAEAERRQTDAAEARTAKWPTHARGTT